MLHVTATLARRTPADTEPDATVRGVYDSAEAARAAADGAQFSVLPVAWSRTSRRPVVGEVLPTTREASGLVAVVLPK